MKAIPPLPTLLKRLEQYWRVTRPSFLASLHPGASTSELAQCAKQLGFELPDELRTLLSWRNGQSEECYGFFEESWIFLGTSAIVDAKAYLDAAGDETSWTPHGIPVFDNDQGDYLFINTPPTGAPLCAYWLGRPECRVVANSLTVWMADFVEQAELGNYVEDAERGRYLRKHS